MGKGRQKSPSTNKQKTKNPLPKDPKKGNQVLGKARKE